MALGWLLAKPFVSTILLGASKMSQLADNLGASDLHLTTDELGQLDSATAPTPLYPQWFQEKTLDAKLKEALGQRY